MDQAKMKRGKWVEVEWRTDGIYANGIKVANVFFEIEKDVCEKLEIIEI